MMDAKTFMGLLDHTLLKAETSEQDLVRICDEAKKYGFATVAVNPANVRFAAGQLAGSGVGVTAAVGFAFGANCTQIKVAEAMLAIEHGATDVDMLVNVGMLKSGRRDLLASEIEEFVKTVNGKAVTKLIFETCLLNDEEKVWLCRCATEKGIQFVKTSTGLLSGGATVEDIRLMKQFVGPGVQVKASGGIRDLATAEAMIEAGATRMGASASVHIAEEFLAKYGK